MVTRSNHLIPDLVNLWHSCQSQSLKPSQYLNRKHIFEGQTGIQRQSKTLDLKICRMIRTVLYLTLYTCQEYQLNLQVWIFIFNLAYLNFYQKMTDIEGIQEVNQPKKIVDVIEPNTTRVLELRRIRQQQQREKRQKRQLEQKRREEEKRRLLNYQRLKKNQQLEERQKLLQEQRRRIEEEQESTRLAGKFGHMINDLNTNTTNHQFTTSGLDLRPTQIKVLITNVQNNSSLKALTMCRKKLTDVEGKQISDRLQCNAFLERLQLEGNLLGPETLSSVATLLKTNDTIRLVDLEGNNLIKGEKDLEKNYKGIEDLSEALKVNETILSLNLNGTGLDDVASQKLREMVESNSTLILCDLENNPKMRLEDVIAIQQKLMKNKQDFDDQRYMEFIERKRMRRQEDISGVLLLNKQTRKLRSEAIELNIKTKQNHLDEEWEQFLQKEEMSRQKEITKMEKEASGKKKKRRR